MSGETRDATRYLKPEARLVRLAVQASVADEEIDQNLSGNFIDLPLPTP